MPTAQDDKQPPENPEPQPVNRLAFLLALLLVGVAVGWYWLTALQPPAPGTTIEQASAYFGTHFVSIGALLVLVGFALLAAREVGTALAAPPDGSGRVRTTAGASGIGDLIGAAGDLVKSPAGIGALLALLGVALLVGGGGGDSGNGG